MEDVRDSLAGDWFPIPFSKAGCNIRHVLMFVVNEELHITNVGSSLKALSLLKCFKVQLVSVPIWK